jgi:NtrC-family two-component system sensor histidine kinase KinB
MQWQYSLYVPILFAAAIISVGLAWYTGKHPDTPGAVSFMVLMLAVAEWALVSGLRLGSVGLDAKLFWAKLRYLGIVVVPGAWLVFALEYTGKTRWLTIRNLLLLAVEPVVISILAWTNDLHHLIWTDIRIVEIGGGILVWNAGHGVAFGIHTLYSYLLVLLGSILLIRASIQAPSLYRGQASVLLLGALAPIMGNILSTFGLVRWPIDLTPFGFILAGLAVTWALFRFRLFDLGPLARDLVLESIEDGVLVLDVGGRIVDANPAASEILGLRISTQIGKRIEDVLNADIVSQYQAIQEDWAQGLYTEVESQVAIVSASTGADPAAAQPSMPDESLVHRRCELHISPFLTRRRRLVGAVIVLHDVTERAQMEDNLRKQKQLFEGLVTVAQVTTERLSLQETLENTLGVAQELTGAESGTLFLLDPSGAVTDSLLIWNRQPLPQPKSVIESVMTKGLAGWVARNRQPALVADTLGDDRWLHLPDIPSASTRSALALPVESGPELLGVLTLTHSRPGHFSVEHTHLMQAAATQMALALRNAKTFDSQSRLAERQATLYRVLRAVAGQLTPESVIRTAVKSIVQFVGWPHVFIALPSEDNTEWMVSAAKGKLLRSVGTSFPIDQGIIGRAFQTLETQLVPDVNTDPDYVVGHPAIRSEMAVPLQRGEHILGVLDIESEQVADFDADDVQLAELLAEAIALTMDNARLYAETRQHLSDLDTLYTVTRMAGQSLSLKDVLTRALSSVLLSLGFEAGLISLVDPVNGHLNMVAEHGLPSALSRRLQVHGLESMLCAYVHDCKTSLVINDCTAETPQPFCSTVSELAEFGLRAYAGIPLLHRERSVGVMSLFTHRPRSFKTEEMALLEAIGRQVATAVDNARLFQATVNERQRLMTLIESSRDGIILVGMDHHILVINAPAIELLSLPDGPADWAERSIHDVLRELDGYAPFSAQAIAVEMSRIKAGNEPPGEGEFEVFPRTIHWLSLAVVAEDTPLGRLWVLRDVTEERLLSKMRDDLTHTMVHDLRNPLTGISVALQLLDAKLANVITPAQHRLFEIAANSTQKMIDLVNAILDLSRLERGQMPLNPAAVALADIVAETFRLQSPLSVDRNLELESRVAQTLPLVWADPGLISRVLQNLVGNAIKFTPAGGSVRVMAQAHGGTMPSRERDTDTERPYIQVSVTDTGPGIPPELKDKLFQKFVVGEQKERGSGLGLAFCKLAVEAHGGRIWVESELGHGATFVFTLPLANDDGTGQMLLHTELGWEDEDEAGQ